MLTGLLITLDILVCIALIGVVLMQRSEGGAFGMGGGPTGLVTARGAGDLLTRTTWVLFGAFLVISLSLTLLGAHDRASSSIVEKLKLQKLNPATMNQPVAPAPAPTPTVPVGPATSQTPGALLAPPPSSSTPLTAPAPMPAAPAPAAAPAPKAKAPHAAAPKPAAPASQSAPPPPVLAAPAPAASAPEPAKPAEAPAPSAP
ncbi:MAG TPA: preprotein translocase subunit SecG [Caulobacteraceae bacterium]|jgi:preprotein translocase subunit SecG|nr:preprotein translocase subunit SecG [Caulobacteraceae bacterium]